MAQGAQTMDLSFNSLLELNNSQQKFTNPVRKSLDTFDSQLIKAAADGVLPSFLAQAKTRPTIKVKGLYVFVRKKLNYF